MTAESTRIPRYQTLKGPALLRQGFRPFFLCAGLWGLLTVPLSLAAFQGSFSIPTAFDPVAWHAHEMVFGYLIAAIAGFLLTAIPNWTGRMPLQGPVLAILVAIWVLGRIASAISGLLGPGLAAVIDLSFLTVLLAVIVREIVAGHNWRNLPMPIALGVLLVANVLIHADVVGGSSTGGVGQRLALAVVVLLLSLVGGRIIPSFTRNWLKKQGENSMPAAFGLFDRISLVVVLVALLAWTVFPHSRIVGAGFVIAGLASLVRLIRWQGHRTIAEPLVWSLHLSFAWIPAGLLMIGCSALLPAVPSTAGLHALTAGAMGSMTLAVMTRAILGHTGRALTAGLWTGTIYALVTMAAALRVVAPFLPELYLPLLWASGLCWSATFGVFVIRFGRFLLVD